MNDTSSAAFESDEQFDRLASRMEKLSPKDRDSFLSELRTAGQPSRLLDELQAFVRGLPDITKRLPGTRIGEGTLLGRYQLIECIGRGGMGVVYRARHQIMRRDVAIKLVRPDLLSIDRIQHFLDEIRNLARLDHPNIIAIHDADVFVDSETEKLVPYYVMPLITGGQAISDYCAGLAPLERLRLFAKLCDAVAYSHSKHQLVHLDLKPANVLIDKNGELHVIDFGVGKILQPVIDRFSDRMIGGTLAYMSPEQMMAGKIGPWSDQYALGVILYQILAGRRPYEVPELDFSASLSRSEFREFIAKAERVILTAVPIPLQKLSPQFEGTLDRIAAKAIHKSPARRFRSVDLLQNEIQRYTETETRRQDKARIYRDRLLKKVNNYCEHMLDTSFLAETARSLAIRVDQVSLPWSFDIDAPGCRNRSVSVSEPLVDIFDNLDLQEGIALMGEAGSGKTTTLLHLARGLARRASCDSKNSFPVLLQLSWWKDSGKPIEVFLVESLESEYLIPREVACRWLSNGSLVLLLDDLDRVAPSNLEVCVRALNDFRREYFVPIILCARADTFSALPVPIRLNTKVRIERLSEAQISNHISRLGPTLAGLKTRIEGEPHLLQLGSTPLLLSIMTLVFQQQNSLALRSLPFGEDRRKKVFDVYVKHKIRCTNSLRFSPEKILRWLNWLAKTMYQHSESDFRMERMQPSWLSSSFEQRLVTGGSAGIIGCVFALILASVIDYYGMPFGVESASVLALGFAGGLLADVFFEFTRVIRPVEWLPPNSWSRVARSLNALLKISFSVSMGLGVATLFATQMPSASDNWLIIAGFLLVYAGTSLTGLCVFSGKGFAPSVLTGWMIVSWSLICLSIFAMAIRNPDSWLKLFDAQINQYLFAAVLIGLIFGMKALFSSRFGSRKFVPAEEPRPSAGIWRYFQNGLLSMLFVGGITGIGITLWFWLDNRMSDGLILGSWIGLMLGFCIGTVSGFFSCVQHLLLRIVLWLNGCAPILRYSSFLDCADTKLAFLRQFNGKFSFYHPLLMDYFAELTPAKIRRLDREVEDDREQ